ncbi:hypothetical protein PR048_000034 [Dryococelus australis]|uniref:DDE Tnp4 domain-containing protein n=1 Tax=Dryococelus australis TaxID=614101 RepID=A0ABQ9IE30_9NEOP|nr:hypothetical protein PR048_000034 [Dryococelus australis]
MFSMVLMEIVDANYKFVTIDVGSMGRFSNGSILAKKLNEQTLQLPPPRSLPAFENTFPYVSVGYEAFPLSEHLTWPYPKKRVAGNIVFNYRLSRARQPVGCAFGILASRFRVFRKCLEIKVDSVDNVVRAACVFHKYLRNNPACGSNMDDNIEVMAANQLLPATRNKTKSTSSAFAVRRKFTEYFDTFPSLKREQKCAPWVDGRWCSASHNSSVDTFTKCNITRCGLWKTDSCDTAPRRAKGRSPIRANIWCQYSTDIANIILIVQEIIRPQFETDVQRYGLYRHDVAQALLTHYTPSTAHVLEPSLHVSISVRRQAQRAIPDSSNDVYPGLQASTVKVLWLGITGQRYYDGFIGLCRLQSTRLNKHTHSERGPPTAPTTAHSGLRWQLLALVAGKCKELSPDRDAWSIIKGILDVCHTTFILLNHVAKQNKATRVIQACYYILNSIDDQLRKQLGKVRAAENVTFCYVTSGILVKTTEVEGKWLLRRTIKWIGSASRRSGVFNAGTSCSRGQFSDLEGGSFYHETIANLVYRLYNLVYLKHASINTYVVSIFSPKPPVYRLYNLVYLKHASINTYVVSIFSPKPPVYRLYNLVYLKHASINTYVVSIFSPKPPVYRLYNLVYLKHASINTYVVSIFSPKPPVYRLYNLVYLKHASINTYVVSIFSPKPPVYRLYNLVYLKHASINTYVVSIFSPKPPVYRLYNLVYLKHASINTYVASIFSPKAQTSLEWNSQPDVAQEHKIKIFTSERRAAMCCFAQLIDHCERTAVPGWSGALARIDKLTILKDYYGGLGNLDAADFLGVQSRSARGEEGVVEVQTRSWRVTRNWGRLEEGAAPWVKFLITAGGWGVELVVLGGGPASRTLARGWLGVGVHGECVFTLGGRANYAPVFLAARRRFQTSAPLSMILSNYILKDERGIGNASFAQSDHSTSFKLPNVLIRGPFASTERADYRREEDSFSPTSSLSWSGIGAVFKVQRLCSTSEAMQGQETISNCFVHSGDAAIDAHASVALSVRLLLYHVASETAPALLPGRSMVLAQPPCPDKWHRICIRHARSPNPLPSPHPAPSHTTFKSVGEQLLLEHCTRLCHLRAFVIAVHD